MEKYMSYFVYLLIIFVIWLLARRAKNNRFFFILLVLVPSVFVGFRGFSVGRDTLGYLSMIEEIRDFGLNNHVYGEIGFNVLIYLVYSIFGSEHLVLFVCALLTYFFYYYTLNKMIVDKNLFADGILFVTCFVMFPSMSAVRQCLATSILFYAYYLFDKKKYVQALTLLTVAILIHTSAITGLFLVLINFIAQSKKNKMVYIILSISVGGLCTISFYKFIKEKYKHLLNEETADNIGMYYIFLIICSIFIVIYLFQIIKNSRESMLKVNVDNIKLYLLFSLGYPVLQLLSMISHSFGRVSWYFSGFLTILFLLPLYLKKNRLFFSILLYLVCLYNYLSITLNNGYNQIPYVFLK